MFLSYWLALKSHLDHLLICCKSVPYKGFCRITRWLFHWNLLLPSPLVSHSPHDIFDSVTGRSAFDRLCLLLRRNTLNWSAFSSSSPPDNWYHTSIVYHLCCPYVRPQIMHTVFMEIDFWLKGKMHYSLMERFSLTKIKVTQKQ